MRRPTLSCAPRIVRVVVANCLWFAVASCATPPPQPPQIAGAFDADPAIADISAGKPLQARAALAPILRAEPQNGYLHLLNGLTYELADHSTQSLELASVGYDSATRLTPGFYWAHYHDGALEYDQRSYADAAEQFAEAILADPDQPYAFLGLAAAAYYSDDLEVATRAIAQALHLDATNPLTLRAAAFIAAGAGDRNALSAILARAEQSSVAAHELQLQRPRLNNIIRVAQFDTPSGPPPTEPAADDPPTSQVMIEVTLLLSQNSTTHRTGINLLDGLQLQFGGSRTTVDHNVSPGENNHERITTTALSIPQISYSLNLFNTTDDYYEVLARPSLVASIGQTSEFFIGRIITVGVSGVNLGSLQPVDVGTTVRVTPVEMSTRDVKFRVEAVRSFFSPETNGTFTESLTTFKQSVNAMVQVEFGRTLILSGLYEAVNIGGSSKTPVLGDVPVIDVAFNARTATKRQDAALVLVTPRVVGTIDTGAPQFRGATLQRLLGLWNSLIEPTAGLDAILKTFQKKSRYFTPLIGDVRLPDANDPKILAATLAATNARLH